MKVDDWLPVSASALVAGAMALLLATVLTQNGATTEDTFTTVQEQSGRWLAGALMYFIATVGLLLGLPCIVVLVQGRGRRTALASCVVLAVGFVGTAGYAALLVFLRALVLTDGVTVSAVDELSGETGLTGFVLIWVGAFYLGEALLALALLRAGPDVCPRWVPALLLLHVASVLATAGPDWVGKVAVVLVALPLCGIAIQVAQRPLAPASAPG